jgi:hypothetical protein
MVKSCQTTRQRMPEDTKYLHNLRMFEKRGEGEQMEEIG